MDLNSRDMALALEVEDHLACNYYRHQIDLQASFNMALVQEEEDLLV